MNRNELKEIIVRVIDRMGEPEQDTPAAGCLFGDGSCDNCDVTSRYAIGEES